MELPNGSIPSSALDALAHDANLPICVTCGTQYPVPRDDCPVCEDPRQWVPESGQAWTTLSDLISEHKNKIVQRDGVAYILTEPTFGIGQAPILIETHTESFLWDCSALISPQLITYLSTLTKPLKVIAISHPHFFSTSLTWSRALKVPLYINANDKQWYARKPEIKDDEVVWWRDKITLSEGVDVIECGGHFPGSSILHFTNSTGGMILTADTIMVQPARKGFTFMWSYPNMIPLPPKDVLRIRDILQPLEFTSASSTWPGRIIKENAKTVLEDSIQQYLRQTGWSLHNGDLRPV